MSKTILETLPKQEEWWLHAFREVIRMHLGYIKSNVHISEEDLEEARRRIAEWMKEAPGLDLRHILALVDRELARRGIEPPDATKQ